LTLPQELTLAQATACLARLDKALPGERESEVVVDARALDRFDSSALAVLLACRRQVIASGKQLVIQGLPSRLADLAALYGVDALLVPDTSVPVK
jgi:phospholipid transport system transporter-binding protein